MSELTYLKFIIPLSGNFKNAFFALQNEQNFIEP